jgi:methionine aminopeptidase
MASACASWVTGFDAITTPGPASPLWAPARFDLRWRRVGDLGSPQVSMLDDGWTAVTVDGSLSCHFEHTVAITNDGPQILTLADDDGDAPRD